MIENQNTASKSENNALVEDNGGLSFSTSLLIHRAAGEFAMFNVP